MHTFFVNLEPIVGGIVDATQASDDDAVQVQEHTTIV